MLGAIGRRSRGPRLRDLSREAEMPQDSLNQASLLQLVIHRIWPKFVDRARRDRTSCRLTIGRDQDFAVPNPTRAPVRACALRHTQDNRAGADLCAANSSPRTADREHAGAPDRSGALTDSHVPSAACRGTDARRPENLAHAPRGRRCLAGRT